VISIASTTYSEDWWIELIKAVIIFIVGLSIVPIILIAERKLLGRFQSRYGPNRVGPYGLLQPVADIGKLLGKEHSRPHTSVGALFWAAPIISILTAVAALAIIPFGPVVDIGGTPVGLYGLDVSIGPLYLFAFGAVAFYGLLVFLVAGFAETNRAPFDLAEADAELVQGYMTEFGGGRFASFYFAEYINMLIVSGVVTTVFLGGWLLPFGLDPPHWVDPFVVLAKMSIIVVLFIWIRATLPRLRYDQLMSLGWKVLLPIATLNALVTAIVVVAQ
jgi:NADH:ubiquinone oxidoreductase subunit H